MRVRRSCGCNWKEWVESKCLNSGWFVRRSTFFQRPSTPPTLGLTLNYRMSSRYGYDDKDMYRRDYSRGSWDRGDRGEVWSDRDRMHDQWQDRRSSRGGGDWDRPSYHEPVVSHWDRRGPPDMDRGPREEWGREPRATWSRAHEPPLPHPSRDRDLYREPPAPRDRSDRAPIPIPHAPTHPAGMDWEGPPRTSGVVRKREAPVEPYSERGSYDRDDSRDRPGRSATDDSDWKRRKVDLDEVCTFCYLAFTAWR